MERDTLPRTFHPKHYALRIADLDFKQWTFSGTVSIQGDVLQASRQLILNTLELQLSTARFTIATGQSDTINIDSAEIEYHDRTQRATIKFDNDIPVSQSTTLTIEYTGIINHDLAGFYRSQYKPAIPAVASVPHDDEWHYMFSTQFESTDARRAFPCFDEPNLKATFDLTLEIPSDQVALSNMPVRTTSNITKDLKAVTFETTPFMSTYLLAWAVGDFDYIEAFTKRQYNGKSLPVRVYATRGLRTQGQWALEHAPKIIDFFSEAFDIDFPLPKSDILAVHEFTHGAMENWGLVTYRLQAILFDEKTSEARFRNRVAYVVAHELAHQWFGNLVTMDWWDELWLNEGFATWAGWFVIDHLHPEWDVWAQFVNEDYEKGMRLDGLPSSHPIQVPVRDALQINQVFDDISYRKGCAVIRMLANHLGVKTFLQGVSAYLKGHMYGNAKTTALWKAIGDVSGKDVNTLMESWIGKIGFPVLTIAEEPRQISIKQSRFLLTGDVKPEDDKTTWWVPLGFQGSGNALAEALTAKTETIRNVDDEYYLINKGANGFYRVNYPPLRLRILGTQLDRLSLEDKIFITRSAADLAFAGQGTTPALLSFIQCFKNETHYHVISAALDAIGMIKSVFGDDEVIARGMDKFTLALVDKMLNLISWEIPPKEDFNVSLLRKRLLLDAGISGHPGVDSQAMSRFTVHSKDPFTNPLPPDFRQPIYRIALRHDSTTVVPFLRQVWYHTPAVDGKEICLSAMGNAADSDIIKSTVLPFLFNLSPPHPAADSVPPGDMHYLASSLAGNRVGRPLLWDYMQSHWPQIMDKLGGNPIILDRFVGVSLSKFTMAGVVDEIDAFFKDKETAAFDRTLEKSKDEIKARARYRERDGGILREWLVANGYA